MVDVGDYISVDGPLVNNNNLNKCESGPFTLNMKNPWGKPRDFVYF